MKKKGARGSVDVWPLERDAPKQPSRIVEASPAAYKEKGRFEQPDRSKEQAWPHPVVSGGKFYVRDQDTLICFDVKAK